MQNNFFRQPLKLILIFLLLLFCSFTARSLYFSQQALAALKNFDFKRGELAAEKALPWPRFLNNLTLQLSPALVIWDESLTTIIVAQATLSQSQALLQNGLLTNNWSGQEQQQQLSIIRKNLEKINISLDKIDTAINKSLILKILPQKYAQQLVARQQQLQNLKKLIGLALYLSSDERNMLIILQNNDELRATGGFMGSYIDLQLAAGLPLPFTIDDIYTAAGQYRGYMEAPAGVKEYLSSGRGWGLADANWSADFPQAAATILEFFANVKEKKYDGVIALNSSVIEKLLAVTGPLYLADYKATVSADNFAQLARVDRQNFFPGSTAKTDFLNAVFSNLRIKLAQTDLQLLWQTLQQVAEEKELLLYSPEPAIETTLKDWQTTGQLGNPYPDSHYYYLVESNVGINKANSLVERQVNIERNQEKTRLSITFSNRNPDVNIPNSNPNLLTATHLNYVNYLRLYLPAETQIQEVKIDGQRQSFSQQTITTSRNQQLTEVSILVVVWAGQDSLVEFIFKEPASLQNSSSTYLQKQPGVSVIPYSITVNGQSTKLELRQDQLINPD